MASKLNQLKSNPINYESLNSDLIQFFIKRREYRNFMVKYREGNINDMTIDGKIVNYPLEFTCINNKYKITGIHPDTDEKVFEKNITTLSYKDIQYELTNLKNNIKNPIYYITLNKLEDLFEKLSIAKANDDSQEILDLKSQISFIYANGGKQYQKLLEKHRFFSTIINDSYNIEISKFSSNLIKSNEFAIKVEEMRNIDSINELAPYLIYRSLIKTNSYFNKNSLVTIDEFKDDIIPENMYLVRHNFLINAEIPNDTKISLLSYGGDIIEKNYGDLIHLDDLNLNINRNFLFDNSHTSDIVDAEFKDGNKMFEIDHEESSDAITNEYRILDKKNPPQYLTRYQPMKKTISKANKSNKPEDKLVNLYESIPLDIDLDTVLMFYSKSRHVAVGKGKGGEKITDTKEESMSQLNDIYDWRKKLSNFFVYRSQKGTILPIIIDNRQFTSIEHYFHFNKFIDSNLDISQEEKVRYNEYANRFTSSNVPNSYVKVTGHSIKTRGGKNSGYKHRKNWNTIQANGFMYKDNILIKAMLAKALQFEEYKNILLATEDSLIIHPKGGNVRSGRYEYATMHMYVRKILMSEHLVVDNYEEQSISDDIEKSIEIKSKLSNLEIENQKTAEIRKSSTPSLESPPKNENFSPVSQARELQAKKAKDLELKKALEAEELRKAKEEFERSRLEAKSVLDKKINAEIEIATQILNTKNISVEGKTKNNILLEAGLIRYLEDTKYFEEYDVLNQMLASDEHGIGGSLLPIPPDGDCLFYSIVEGLKKHDIFPMNFKDEEDNQYSKNNTELLLVAGDLNTKGNIHRDAALELRNDIAKKLETNLKIDSGEDFDNTDQSAMFASIISEYDSIEDYIQSIKLSARPPSLGLWGGENEIIAAAALLNINITVLDSNGTTKVYSAIKSREILPKAPNFNTGSDVAEIKLGYLNNGKHYILISNSVKIIEDMSSKQKIIGYKYFKADIGTDKKMEILGAMVVNNDGSISLIGIYDKNTGRIITKPEGDMKEAVFNNVIDKLNDTLEDIAGVESELTDIIYLKDLENNEVYWKNDNGEEIQIGKFIGEEKDVDGDLITDKSIKFKT